ncbi:MAG: right-handed parallel beta-helix repeat-containing protein [Phycisphaerales bacterium]|nr:right-handed parallel beta-helix repeat-containing protein [Phycisphaerales bacterium]
MASRNRQIAFAVAAVVSFTSAPWVHAGDLNPPPGVIFATNRITLNAQSITLPYTISASGSYVLTSDLRGVAGQDGIIITTDNVTLDLNGFSLLGVPGSGDGVQATGSRRNLTIRNGVIRDWGGMGVRAGQFPDIFAHSRYEGLTITGNSGGGAQIGTESIVTGCVADANTGFGFNVNAGVLIVHSVASGNSGNGIEALGTENVNVVDCNARNNGIVGITVSAVSLIDRCDVTRNPGGGIHAGQNTVVRDCSVSFNPGANYGIRADTGCLIQENNCGNNGGDGITVVAGAQRVRIDGNNCNLNAGNGIDVGPGTNIFVARNSCGGNAGGGGDYIVGAGNFVGTLTAAPAAAGAWHNFDF